ncbi:uncharacterized protein ATNIH1004_004205 [Aspergillus tanneri]|uniref:Uncharacterized protein n=1 Tax=Aspergillus tanneri TaxID=1220188 RepID=A0A5M9MSJ7_9EURO|nr:uncharacterized protein ATNIH1004_004205 [Aspergillus tanneri]KAA8648320.1 hypothetical protein ATNIH1004_004205 [Aspergillus tanneri]
MDALEQIISKLEHVSANKDKADDVKIENFIGFTFVPLGIAGPLRITGTTTEATLVASCSRGCKAFSACSGFLNIEGAVRFFEIVPRLWSKFQKPVESTSSHIRLEKITHACWDQPSMSSSNTSAVKELEHLPQQ